MSSRALSSSRKAGGTAPPVVATAASPEAETLQLTKANHVVSSAGASSVDASAAAPPWVVPLFVATTDDANVATDFLSLFPRAFMDGTELIVTPANVSKVGSFSADRVARVCLLVRICRVSRVRTLAAASCDTAAAPCSSYVHCVLQVPTLYSEELCQAACRTVNHRLCSQTDVQMQLYGPYIRSISLMFMREAMHRRMTFNDVVKQVRTASHAAAAARTKTFHILRGP